MLCWRPTAPTVLLLLCMLNLVNYVDRGVISGAPAEFDKYILLTLSTDQQGVWFGLLTSAFIGCYSIGSLLFGHLMNFHPPFRLLGLGLSLWVTALALSGLAFWLPREPWAYWFLVIMRAATGAGEAALQCIVPTYIEDFSPPAHKTLWLAAFFTMIPVGQALGLVYGSIVAQHGWGYAYLIEAVVLVPFVILSFHLPPARELTGGPRAEPLLMNGAGLPPAHEHGHPSDAREPEVGEASEVRTVVCCGTSFALLSQLSYLMTSPAFVLLLAGYAAYTFTIIGVSSFGPQFLLGLGVFEDEVTCSLVFGVTAALGGLIGTPLGGVLLDRYASVPADLPPGSTVPTGAKAQRLWQASRILAAITIFVAAGGAFLVADGFVCGWLQQPQYMPLAMGFLCIGVLLSFATSSGITRAILLIVPAPMRGFAIAVQILGLHTLGDVPAPLVVGAVKDQLAPGCGMLSNQTTHETHLNPQCRDSEADQQGLRLTLVLTCLWIMWAPLVWGLCYLVLRRRMRQAENDAFVPY
mgnify:CR=1 FL=1